MLGLFKISWRCLRHLGQSSSAPLTIAGRRSRKKPRDCNEFGMIRLRQSWRRLRRRLAVPQTCTMGLSLLRKCPKGDPGILPWRCPCCLNVKLAYAINVKVKANVRLTLGLGLGLAIGFTNFTLKWLCSHGVNIPKPHSVVHYHRRPLALALCNSQIPSMSDVYLISLAAPCIAVTWLDALRCADVTHAPQLANVICRWRRSAAFKRQKRHDYCIAQTIDRNKYGGHEV